MFLIDGVFEEDSEKLHQIYEDYESGVLLNGRIKENFGEQT